MNENIKLEESIENFINILEAKNTNQNLNTLSNLGDILENDDSNLPKDFEGTKKYFDSAFTSTEDKNMKKIAMAATMLAKQNNALPDEMKDLSDEKLFAVVDEALNNTKVAYQYAEGIFESEDEAFEQLLDTTAARVKTFIDSSIPAIQKMAETATENYLPKAVNYLMDAVDSAYPQFAPVTQWVRQFSPVIAKAVKPVVRKGIECLGNFAKKASANLADKGKVLWKYAKNWLKS